MSNIPLLQKSGSVLGGWVRGLWLAPPENALRDLVPGMRALWLWANVLLFETFQGVFFTFIDAKSNRLLLFTEVILNTFVHVVFPCLPASTLDG